MPEFKDNPTRWAIRGGDCLVRLQEVPTGSVDLVFADPPFNIGYDYLDYTDDQEVETYLAWYTRWMLECYRVLKPSGTFWLAIGDEHAASCEVLATMGPTVNKTFYPQAASPLPKEQRAGLLEPFYRGGGKTSGGGYGLGLAIAERVIAAVDGQIRAKNAAGGGLLVEIELAI